MAVGEVVQQEVLVLEGGAEAVVGVRQPRVLNTRGGLAFQWFKYESYT